MPERPTCDFDWILLHAPGSKQLLISTSLCFFQIWHLQSEAQKEVDLALKDLRRLRGPTVAFHVRGDDSSGDEELLFDVGHLWHHFCS